MDRRSDQKALNSWNSGRDVEHHHSLGWEELLASQKGKVVILLV